MKIELKEIRVGELVEGYQDNQENGVIGYGGKLDIRPPYQREFVYKEKQREAVIDTITKGFPLNVMYWAVRDNGGYEVIDGQQRTISIAQYVKGDFSFVQKYFHNLENDQQSQILDYRLTVYLCTGADSEKLAWFKTINIAGEKLTDQELRNAVYHGSWVGDAKRYFSKNGCAAYNLGHQYLSGSAIRQDYLETAIKWHSGIAGEKISIEEYMAQRQHEPNANELRLYFERVIAWVKVTFPNYRKKEMKGLDWGEFYNAYGEAKLDPNTLEEEISRLMKDDDVESKKGVYGYVLTGKEHFLNIRAFSDSQKRQVYEKQGGICPLCKGDDTTKKWDLSEMEGDHITPWSEGGKTVIENCQMLCKDCNRRKSNK